MAVGLYSGVSGLALGVGLYKNVSGLWGGSSGLINGFGGSGPFPGASLYLDFLTPPLDSRITFSRGSNATLVDATGKITYAPNNLLTWSEDLTNAVWLASASTKNTATKFTAIATNNIHAVSQNLAHTLGVTYIYQQVLTYDNNRFVSLRLLVGIFPHVCFDLVNGTVAGSEAGASGTITSLGGGSYLCTITVTATSTGTGNAGVFLQPNATNYGAAWLATGTEAVTMTKAQVEQVTYQTTPSTYVATTASAYYGPRFDYDPVTLAPKGLLIEEQRTNLQTYSSDWTNAIWSKTNITVTAAATASPDGTVNAQRLAATATAATVISGTPVAVAATSATYSIYVKQGTGAAIGNTFLLRNSTTATILLGGTINYATGAWTYSTGSTGVIVSNAGNGWWRIQMSATTGITSGDLLHGYVGWGGASATAGDFIFAYGAQLEAGAFATSYIPTVASTVTRSADVATMTGTNFSSWYNQSEGTFIAQYAISFVSNEGKVALTAGLGADNNFSVRIGYSSGPNTVTGASNIAGVNQAVFAQAAVSTNYNEVAMAYKTDDFGFSANGSTPATDTSGSVYSPNSMSIGRSGSAYYLNGWITAIAYYNTRLPNAQLQTLTAPSLATTLTMSFTDQAYTVGV
jgi:hypothetical protein